MENSSLRKRKREGAGQLEQKTSIVGLQEVPHPELIDLNGAHHGSPLPPGWEQCLDLQSGEMYFVNSATQMRVSSDPRCNQLTEWATGQGQTGSSHSGMTLGLDLGTKLPSSATGFGRPGLPSGEKLLKDPALREQQGSIVLNSSLKANLNGVAVNPDMNMVATVCVHCHTFVMVSRHFPHCPSCKNLCNVNPLPATPGNGQA